MSGILLASFPNSRIKPRPATTSSDTFSITVPTAVATLIAAANPNRTVLTIRNTSPTDAYYGYDAGITVAPGPTSGFLLKGLDSVDIQDPGDVYVIQSSGVAIQIDVDAGQG